MEQVGCSRCGGRLGRDNTSGVCRKCRSSELGKQRAPFLIKYGEEHPQWKGDAARVDVIHERARRLYPIIDDQECDRCTELAVLRHHIDEDPTNNNRSNIEFLCRACHVRHHKPRLGTGAVR